jgi:stage II sporulation protein P
MWSLGFSLALLLLVALAPAPGARALSFVPCSPDQYFTVVSEHGETLAKLALSVSRGDYLITEDNRGWTVISVKGRTARARFDQWVNLEAAVDQAPLGERLAGWFGGVLAQVRGGARHPEVGIYHTHSDEAYVPTTGKASMSTGDIYKVGATLADGLQRHGFAVDHSFNNHNPHDGAAYHRSRRTVTELMQRRPAAIFDVHRDAIPDPNYYRKQVAGETIAQVRLVVGKQNQNRAVNFDFAKRIKAEANRLHPGLVKEIFWARGNYNQDVSPRAILFEFGTHTNSEEMARRGATLLADALPVVITGRRQVAPTARPHATRPLPQATRVAQKQSRPAGFTALWIALVVVAAAGIFLAINGGIGKGLKKFTGQELSGFLGRYRGRAKGSEGDDRKGGKGAAEETGPDDEGKKDGGPGPGPGSRS